MIESFYKNSRRLWNLICNFLLSRILWLQVVKCSNVRHFPSPLRICKCCGCVFFRGYHHIICHPLLKKGVPCVCKTYHWGGEFTAHFWPRRGGNSLTFSYIKRECPISPEGVAGASNDWTGAVTRHAKMKNEIQICFSKWWENETRNSYPFFKVMRKRKTKTEIDVRFLKVMRKRKTK